MKISLEYEGGEIYSLDIEGHPKKIIFELSEATPYGKVEVKIPTPKEIEFYNVLATEEQKEKPD